MTREDIERFEAATGELLDELGYERAASNLGHRAKRHATAVRESFVGEARQRLPER
jgi:hypothetical protein